MTDGRATRREILRTIEEHPGLHLRALEDLLRLPLGTLRHHLKRLEAWGLVRVEFDLRFKRYFPHAMGADLRETCSALRPRQMRRIVVLLSGRGTATTSELAQALGLPRSSLGLYLRRLRQKGVIHRSPDAEFRWSLKNEGVVREALATYHSSFVDRVVDGTLEVFDAAAAVDPPPRRRDPAEE